MEETKKRRPEDRRFEVIRNLRLLRAHKKSEEFNTPLKLKETS